MDELAYAINGENAHYGTPINPRARALVPGGSSSGSAGGVRGGAPRMRFRARDGYRGIRASAGVVLWGLRDTHESWIGVYARCAGFGAEF